jgi:hypothetical protein
MFDITTHILAAIAGSVITALFGGSIKTAITDAKTRIVAAFKTEVAKLTHDVKSVETTVATDADNVTSGL